VRLLPPAVGAAAVLGFAFLGLQAMSWLQVWTSGMKPNTGPYASVFYMLTWFHALHVAVGVLALAVLAWRAFRGAYSLPRHQPLRLWTMYWHFVGVVWTVLFVTVYLI
jgi:heme/copper-type cytochrome/quinol oxidase subunit 3